MKDDNFSERLNFVLDQEGFPPKNRGRIQLLADLVDLSHRGASKWVNGESCPPAKKFADIANKLHVNEAWLKTGRGFMRQSQIKTEGSPLAIFARPPQEVPIYSNSHFMAAEKIPQTIMHCYLPQSGDFFGIVLASEAMSPRFPGGSILIFEKNASIRDGDFVLVNYPTYPEPLFRQILLCESASYLIASNPKFDRLTLGRDDQILGRVVQVICSFD